MEKKIRREDGMYKGFISKLLLGVEYDVIIGLKLQTLFKKIISVQNNNLKINHIVIFNQNLKKTNFENIIYILFSS